jgi:hypothetical protein
LLKRLEEIQPLRLTLIAPDQIAGVFRDPVADPGALAQRIYAFCPDVVDQGHGSVAALAGSLAKEAALYLWWD